MMSRCSLGPMVLLLLCARTAPADSPARVALAGKTPVVELTRSADPYDPGGITAATLGPTCRRRWLKQEWQLWKPKTVPTQNPRLTSGSLIVRPGHHLDRSMFELRPPSPLELNDSYYRAQSINVGLKIRF